MSLLNNKYNSFENAKSTIINSALGKALGMSSATSLSDVANKISAVVNRGALNWSSSNTTYTVPAGYYSGGTLDSRPSYNAGVTAGKSDISFSLAGSWTSVNKVQTTNYSCSNSGLYLMIVMTYYQGSHPGTQITLSTTGTVKYNNVFAHNNYIKIGVLLASCSAGKTLSFIMPDYNSASNYSGYAVFKLS